MELSPLIRDTLMPQFLAEPNVTGNHCPKATILRILEAHLKMLEATLPDTKSKLLATAAFALRGRTRVKRLLAELSLRTLASYFTVYMYQWINLTGELTNK